MTKRNIVIGVAVVVVVMSVLWIQHDRSSVIVDAGIVTQSAGRPLFAPAALGLFGSSTSKSSALAEFASNTIVPASAPDAARDTRLVIKTGSFSLVVANIQDVVTHLVTFTEQKGGFVVSKYVSEQDQKPSGNVTVRIPAAELEALVSEARGASIRVVSEQITGQDVTEEYVDIKAQLTNLTAAENRFRELLTRAQKIEEILNVQREIDRVRSQIDQVTARKQYLERSAAMSSVTFYLALDEQELPLITPGEQWRPKVVYQEAVRGLYGVGRSLGSFAIWFVVMAPVWIILIAVWFVARYFVRRYRHKS